MDGFYKEPFSQGHYELLKGIPLFFILFGQFSPAASSSRDFIFHLHSVTFFFILKMGYVG
jgi:hypothetical protein